MDPRYFSDDDFGRIICEAFHDHRDMGAVNWNAVARTVRAQLKAETWLPMSTAPDHQAVLLCVPPFAPMQGVRSRNYGTWMVGAQSIIGRVLMPGTEPRAWMPLPDPPEEPKP